MKSPWVGLHAAAFAAASLVQSAALLHDRLSSVKILGEDYAWLLAAALGVAAAAAQGVVLRRAPWALRTLLGIWAGAFLGTIAARQFMIFLVQMGVDFWLGFMLGAVVGAISEGCALGVAHWKGPVWGLAAGGSWLLARAFPALMLWATGFPLAGESGFWTERGRELLLQTGCGVLFAAPTSFLLRKRALPQAT